MSEFGVYLLDPDSMEKTFELPISEGEFDILLRGGCGLGRFTMPWRVEHYDYLTQEYIYWPMRVDVLDNPIWQGRIESIRPRIGQKGESIEVSCCGWGLYLEQILHQWQYVKDGTIPTTGLIITRYSDIARDLFRIAMEELSELSLGEIQDSDMMPDAASGYQRAAFTVGNDSIFDAMKTLCRLAGNWQWGVDRERKLYFKPVVQDIAYELVVGRDIAEFSPILDASKMVNKILLRGATSKEVDTGKEYRFFAVYQDTASIAQYGTHFKIVSESYIRDLTVGEDYANAYFDAYATPQHRAEITVTPNIGLFEPSLGRVHIFIPPDGHYYFTISQTRYKLSDAGITVEPKLGFRPPDLVSEIIALRKELEKLLSEGATSTFYYLWSAGGADFSPSMEFQLEQVT